MENTQDETETIFGWPAIAKALDLSVRRAREVVGERRLVAERRADGAVGVPAQSLRELAEEISHRRDAPTMGQTEDGPLPTNTLATATEGKPEATVQATPTVDGALSRNGADITADRNDEDRNFGQELDRHCLLAERLADRIEGVSHNVSAVATRADQAESLLWHAKQSAAHDRQLLWALKAEVQHLRRQVATMEGALKAMPMALAATGHKCGSCGAKALVSPVGCGACGFGVGPSR